MCLFPPSRNKDYCPRIADRKLRVTGAAVQPEPPGLPAARLREGGVRQPQDTALRLSTVRPPVH